MATRQRFLIPLSILTLLAFSSHDDRRSANAQEVDAKVPSQNQSNEKPNNEKNADPSESDRSKSENDFSDNESPSLGVLVGSCPGGAVCVIDTMVGSPAESAGIRAGDYILAINDQDVTSPNELKQKIEGLERTDTINVSLWRRGRTLTKQVALASNAKELPGHQRSWLGVMLGKTDQLPGVMIQDVHDNSPAYRAGLQVGDRVLQINGKQVESIEQFVESVREDEPGAELKLEVQRDKQELQMSVVLGEISSAPMQWFRRSSRMPTDESEFSMPLSPSMGMMEEVIDEMRAQIRSLEMQVDEMKRPVPPPVSSSLEGVDAAPASQPDEDDASSSDKWSSKFTTLVQYDGRRGFRPNISNDWTGSRYGRGGYLDRDYRFQERYRSYYGNGGFQPNPYNYYQRGGRPYYYGGRSPLGYRGGVRIGPNFSVWW